MSLKMGSVEEDEVHPLEDFFFEGDMETLDAIDEFLKLGYRPQSKKRILRQREIKERK